VFERFTAEARSVVVRAQEDARELGQPSIGTPTILLGVAEARARQAAAPRTRSASARTTSATTSAAGRCDAIRHSPTRTRTRFGASGSTWTRSGVRSRTFGPGALDRGRGSRGHIPFTRGAKKALELSLREAIALGHKQIGTEHLLLGLVRDECSSAASILEARGVERGRVRAQVLREIASGGDQSGRTA
jgi:Clp amino terminal domain, pathogenicity island component